MIKEQKNPKLIIAFERKGGKGFFVFENQFGTEVPRHCLKVSNAFFNGKKAVYS